MCMMKKYYQRYDLQYERVDNSRVYRSFSRFKRGFVKIGRGECEVMPGRGPNPSIVWIRRKPYIVKGEPGEGERSWVRYIEIEKFR